ncbi:CocE/NonD family hydrolase [Streptosporangium longisporum]|uniref:CocE/NonD family hydrolase n=1 Tax=Streptosporangium longisporum TaxID=46187 RepID=A0ABP6KNP3_9ACTN
MSAFNLRVPGWDGTPLAVDVQLPDPSLWPVPAVVTRTPYGRSHHLAEGRGWTRRGFAYVVQDVRGRHDSDGVWECYRNERGDGAALADWALSREWSDGRLIGYGGSYSGFTAWALAAERPDSVPVVVSMGPSMALHRTKFEDGVLRLAEHAAWWLDRADSRTGRDGLASLLLGADPGVLSHLPVTGLPERLGVRLPGWAGVVRRGPDHRPEEEITESELAGLPVSGMHIGGWYDLLVDETLLHWRTVGTGRAPRPPQWLVVGPWGHDLAFTGRTRYGDREHGPVSSLDLGALQVEWIRACLDGTARAGELVLPVGADTWRPWPRAEGETVLHAHPAGTLRDTPPDGPAGSFRHDPDDPCPSLAPGTDRRGLDARADVLRFTATPLTTGTTLTGAHVDLEVGASAGDADWIVRLVERTATGQVFELARGRAAGSGRCVLSPFAAVPASGSRLRLEIGGGDFPRLARSLGTGADRYTTTATAPVRQTVHAARLSLRHACP